MKKLKSLVQQCLDTDYFKPNEEGVTPIPFVHVPGNSRLVVVVGDNASGKSFFRRIFEAVCVRDEIDCITLNMQDRCSSEISRLIVYGNEDSKSTGENSINTVLGSVRTSFSRTDNHTIFWDEPDIGLSADWSAGIGQKICELIMKPPKHLFGGVVVTHSKPLVEQLMLAKPHYIHLGTDDAPPNLKAWLNKPVRPQNIEHFEKHARKRWKLIQAVINKKARAVANDS